MKRTPPPSSLLLLFLAPPSARAQQQLRTCTGPILRFPPPSKGRCLTSWGDERGVQKLYPDDFEGISNEVRIYRCPSSAKRVIISNGIPDHDVTLQNRIGPCEVNWAAELPLHPTVAVSTGTQTQRTEIPIRGMIAMATNGVPAYGPQEADYLNAVEGTMGVPGARFWYGHSGPNSAWHFHNPKMGRELESRETLLGYAMDGFPIYGHLEDDSELDACNGMYDEDDGTYRYHVRTLDQVDDSLEYCNGDAPETNWNYILGCYSGSVEDTRILDSETYSLDGDCVIDDGASTTTTATQGTPIAPSTTSTEQSNDNSTAPKKRPNVIIMQPDDMPFYDAWGPPPDNPSAANKKSQIPKAGLPHIESLRKNGLQMMQAYTSSAMCGTSRFSTLTSRYPSRAKSNRGDGDAKAPSIVSIPTTKIVDDDCARDNIAVQFRDNGYRTAMIGKWHLSYIDDSTYTYDDAANTVKQCGFDTVGGLYVENLKSSDNFNNYHDGSFSHNMEWITHEAIKVIEDDSTEPFFMYFNPTVPHLSNSISSALSDFSCRDTAAGTLDEDPVIPGMTDDGCASYRQTIFDRAEGDKDLGAIWIDDSVGALLTSLEGAGKLDDTIFLFQADHGINPKGALYEGAVRIPQFIHYPSGISAGAQFDLPVSVIDVGVTMLNFSGITPSYEMDGRSWKEAVSNENFRTGWVDRCLYFEVERDRAVRCGCYKYLDIFDEEESTTLIRGVRMGLSHDERNLFDLCGGSVDLATDTEGKNMEVENLIDQETSMGSNFETLLECHLERIEAADFSQCQLSRPIANPCSVCSNGMTADGDTDLGRGHTCDSLMVDALTVEDTSDACTNMKEEESICCPAPSVNPCLFCAGGITAEEDDQDLGQGDTCESVVTDALAVETDSQECTDMLEEESTCCPPAPELADVPCSVCAGGLTVDESVDLGGERTCGGMITDALSVEDSSEECTAMKGREGTCCPPVVTPVPTATPETEAGVTPVPTTTPETEAGVTPVPTATPETEAGVTPVPLTTPETEAAQTRQPQVSVPETSAPQASSTPAPTGTVAKTDAPTAAAGVPAANLMPPAAAITTSSPVMTTVKTPLPTPSPVAVIAGIYTMPSYNPTPSPVAVDFERAREAPAAPSGSTSLVAAGFLTLLLPAFVHAIAFM